MTDEEIYELYIEYKKTTQSKSAFFAKKNIKNNNVFSYFKGIEIAEKVIQHKEKIEKTEEYKKIYITNTNNLDLFATLNYRSNLIDKLLTEKLHLINKCKIDKAITIVITIAIMTFLIYVYAFFKN